mgnify:CR=1 FL=1
MGMRTIGVHWFSQLGPTIGILTREDEDTGERFAYIGTGEPGNSEEEDAKKVAEWGCKVEVNRIRVILAELEAD